MTRGGARAGAGRPAKETVIYYRRVKPEWVEMLDAELNKLKGNKKMTTVKELLEAEKQNEYADVELYVPAHSNWQNDNRCRQFHTDYVNGKDITEETANYEVMEYKYMDEEDYNRSLCANTGIKADFAEWYDNKDAKVLVILAVPTEEE